MSRRDTYHEHVKRALVKDGWQITHDPFTITYEGTSLSTDLGAQKARARAKRRIAVEVIAVEVKDFDGLGMMSEFEKALGQYRLYRALLDEDEPDRALFLAVRHEVWTEFFQRPAIQVAVKANQVHLVIFDEHKEEILQWIE